MAPDAWQVCASGIPQRLFTMHHNRIHFHLGRSQLVQTWLESQLQISRVQNANVMLARTHALALPATARISPQATRYRLNPNEA